MSKEKIEKMVDDLIRHWYEIDNNPYRDAIIAKLRAADKLCEAAKKSIEDGEPYGGIDINLDEAITEYEGKG